MIVRKLDEVQRSERRVVTETWESTRMILRSDGVGFSFHITTMYPNTETRMWYKNHFESVYCIEGQGELEDLENNTKYVIEPGTMYLLDGHERHVLRAHSRLVVACVFNPPCSGQETHDENGAYMLSPGQQPPALEKNGIGR
ncbi:MAG: ectoine synthase [Bdellovibrionales bacterium]|nr:ectoine synthase [Bdellovibrionales bacterium]